MGTFGRIYYNIFMYPFEKILLGRIRRNLMGKARGNSLEIGFGTGVNLKYYDFEAIDSIILLERNMIKGVSVTDNKKVSVMEGDVMELPFEDNTFDTVIFTLVFCSVEHPERGLSEMRRVLKDNGHLIFIEHVVPEGKTMKKIAGSVNGTWSSMSNGCNLNRDTVSAIRDAGFHIVESDFSRKGVFVSGTAKKRRPEAFGVENQLS